jgi:glycosyltransferase involved in cell wall biosynthesis
VSIDISIILPFHNAKRWLGAALKSIQWPSTSSAEIIAIDDGSYDDSSSIADQLAMSGLPIKLLKNDRNIGIVGSLNRGLDVAKGRYIARMDADDICMPSRLARQLAFIQKTGCDVCGTWFIEFGQGIPRTVRWPHSESALKAAMLFQNAMLHPSIMARREVFDRFRYREEYRLVEDYDLFGRACGEFRMANIPEPLLRYRRHASQATQAKRDAMEQITRRVRLEILERQGFQATAEEQRLHNLIRAPYSINNINDLTGIEAWLLKLHSSHTHPDARRVIASQWIRACIRAAPLGDTMLCALRASPLYAPAYAGLATRIDLKALAALRIDYRSKLFSALRRFGLSS